jgi:DNA replication protein DnaC
MKQTTERRKQTMSEDFDDMPGMIYPDQPAPVVPKAARNSEQLRQLVMSNPQQLLAYARGNQQPRRTSQPETLGGIIGDNPLKARLELMRQRVINEAPRQREADYDAPPPNLYIVRDRQRPDKKYCPECHYMVDLTDNHGWLHNYQTMKEEPCPVCSPPVIRARNQRASARLIKELVALGRFFDKCNLPPEAFNLSLSAFPAAGDQGAKRAVEMFINERLRNLILIGPPGTGKTGLAISAVKVLVSQGKQALFLPMSQYVDMAREDADYHNPNKTHIEAITRGVEVLFLDDMGLEVVTRKTLELTQKLIEARHAAGLRTFITTNLTLKGLLAAWNLPEYDRSGFQPAARTIDRLKAWYRPIEVKSASLRSEGV